mmetsp:Transcript_50958/g.62399  ORF Transcript_50958/g.62399 Transcript_50958/m.62399 type:complete len:212 (-) Transcript_50958:209-844(-)
MTSQSFKKLNIKGILPKPRLNHTMVTNGTSKFYIFGGRNNDEYYSDVWSFELLYKSINKLKSKQLKTTNKIEGRAFHGMIYYNKALYIFCGQDEDGDNRNDVWCLELSVSKYTWKNINIKNMPKLSAFTCHLYNNYILMFGGMSGDGTDNRDLYSIDLLNKEINKMEINYNNIIFKGNEAHSSCVYDDKLFIFGGCNDEGTINDNNIYYIW